MVSGLDTLPNVATNVKHETVIYPCGASNRLDPFEPIGALFLFGETSQLRVISSSRRAFPTVVSNRPRTFRSNMAFTFVALAYIIAMILTALLLFLAIWHVGVKNDVCFPHISLPFR
mgnify:CR=1 FL=1